MDRATTQGRPYGMWIGIKQWQPHIQNRGRVFKTGTTFEIGQSPDHPDKMIANVIRYNRRGRIPHQ